MYNIREKIKKKAFIHIQYNSSVHRGVWYQPKGSVVKSEPIVGNLPPCYKSVISIFCCLFYDKLSS